jgi:hypothetical protein
MRKSIGLRFLPPPLLALVFACSIGVGSADRPWLFVVVIRHLYDSLGLFTFTSCAGCTTRSSASLKRTIDSAGISISPLPVNPATAVPSPPPRLAGSFGLIYRLYHPPEHCWYWRPV